MKKTAFLIICILLVFTLAAGVSAAELHIAVPASAPAERSSLFVPVMLFAVILSAVGIKKFNDAM